MAHVGKSIEHPWTGERITFLETASTSGGERLSMEFEMRPGGEMPSAHVHPRAEERFTLTAGRLRITRAGETRTVGSGETIVVPRGVSHAWGNPYDEPARVIIDLCPAYQVETFFETFFGLAVDGLVDPKNNMPKSFLQAAVLTDDYRGQIELPGAGGTALRILARALAPVGRRRGYMSRYSRYSDTDETPDSIQ
jgi:quercetin dioxygenase-like cupin family protein